MATVWFGPCASIWSVAGQICTHSQHIRPAGWFQAKGIAPDCQVGLVPHGAHRRPFFSQAVGEFHRAMLGLHPATTLKPLTPVASLSISPYQRDARQAHPLLTSALRQRSQALHPLTGHLAIH